MRSLVKAVAAALMMLLAGSAAAQEQPADSPPAPPPAVAAALPDAPVPYTKIRPQRRPAPKARPQAAASPASAAAVAPAATPAPAIAGAVPVVASLPTGRTGARLAPGQPIPPAELEAFVDGMVRDAMAREHIAGVTVSVVQNGQVVLKKGYGFASLMPQRAVDPDRTLFRIASISKTFTWVALMRQVEAGRMRLDQPVNAYLPERVRLRAHAGSGPVRLSHLMDHSAGFEDRALGQLFEAEFNRVRPLDLYLRQERPRRVRPAGSLSTYSNYGVALAGLATATAARKPFEQLIEDEILRPLGMWNTTFREPHPPKSGIPAPMPAALAANLSDGYRWTPAGFEKRGFEHVGHAAPAGSASSTAGDMARYMLMQLGGGQLNGVTIYGPRGAQAFRTPLRRTPAGVNGWAHGFIVYDLPGGFKGYGHDGATLSFLSNMTVVPELGLGVFISTNTETGASLATRFPYALVRQFYAQPQTFPRAGSPELIRARGDFEGYYVSTRRAYGGLEGFVTRIAGGAAVNVTPEGRLFIRTFQDGRTYSLDGPADAGGFISSMGDQRLRFRMENGRAETFQLSDGARLFVRAPWQFRPETLVGLAALTGFAALATLIGIFLRNRRELRENQIQARAALVQNIQAGLWLAAFVLMGVWFGQIGDITRVMYDWPGALLVTASSCALVAAALTLVTIAALPAVWRGGRRVDSWTPLRKVFFTLTVAIYSAFAVVLGMWGALAPWSS